MDLFNTMFWAGKDEKYSDWGSIYPGFAFFIIDLFKLALDGTASDGFELRYIGQYSVWLYLVSALVCPLLLVRSKIYNFSILDGYIYYVLIITSVPFLFALERGNIIIFCLPLIPLIFFESKAVRSISLATLINIKPYFLVVNFAILKDFDNFVLTGIISLFFFLVFGFYASADFYLIFENIFRFSNQSENVSVREIISFPSSLSAWSDALKLIKNYNSNSFIESFLDLDIILDLIRYGTIIFSFYAFFQSREKGQPLVIVLFIVLLTNFNRSTGGYTIIFFFAIFPLIQNIKYSTLSNILISICILPLDVVPIITENIGRQSVYLSGVVTDVYWTLGLGAVMRPFANQILLFFLGIELLRIANRPLCRTVR